ncbi:MAG TPA: SDR family oxidoreductase, partial [Candidatus Acidoferrum sp.]|nr:SDR family oxidoreductase [Candidatus Acidoferrum sp.]
TQMHPDRREGRIPAVHAGDDLREPEDYRLARQMQPREIAAAVAYLASDDAAFVTGHALVVDGGSSQIRASGLPFTVGRFADPIEIGPPE